MQLVDPWGGMKRGMAGYTNTLRDINEQNRLKKRDDSVADNMDRRTKIAEERNEREIADRKIAMLNIQKRETLQNYEVLKNIKTEDDYNVFLRYMQRKQERAAQTSPELGEALQKAIDEIPAYDLELKSTGYMGSRRPPTGDGTRPNPDSKFAEYQQQGALELMAQKSVFEQELERALVKYGSIKAIDTAAKKEVDKNQGEIEKDVATHKKELEGDDTGDVGELRKYNDQGQTITEEKQADGSWKVKASSPQWKPDATPESKLDEINKTLKTLHKERTSIASTKGIDPLTLLFGKDNPSVQAALKNGDVKSALAEYDKQIEYYEGERNALTPAEEAFNNTESLPEGVTEADIEFTLKQHPEMTREKLLEQLNAN